MALLQFSLVRPDDNVSLRVETDLAPVVTADGWALLPPPSGGTGRITVDFPPQHVVEYADDSAEPPTQPSPIYAPPTRVVFTVPTGGAPFPLSVAGVLEAIATLPITTSPDAPFVAAPADPDGDRVGELRSGPEDVLAVRRRRAHNLVRRDAAAADDARGDCPATDDAVRSDPAATDDALRDGTLPDGTLSDDTLSDDILPAGALPNSLGPVSPTTTSVAMPARLELAVAGGATRFSHAAAPVEHDGLVEQWHSRFVVATLGGGPRIELQTPATVRSFVPAPASQDATWSKIVDEATVNNALSSVRAGQIAAAAQLPQSPSDTRRPLDLEGLVLSPLGGSVRLAGSWNDQPIAGYRHQIVHGRDDEVRIDIDGQLYPFGHRARLTTVTKRLARSATDGSTAVLRTTSVLQVLQPVVTFPDDVMARQLPFTRVEVLTRVSPPGEFVTPFVFVDTETHGFLTVGGQAYRSELRAVDHAEHVTTFSLPLYFVPSDTPVSLAALGWNSMGPEFTDIVLDGQAVGLAPAGGGSTARDGDAGAADATTLLTSVIHLAAANELPPPDFRAVARSFVGTAPVLGALDAALGVPGDAAMKTFSYAQQYLDAGFDALPAFPGAAINPGELLLKVERTLTEVAADTVGLVRLPQLPIEGISRLVGAVSASGDTPEQVAVNLAKAALGEFDPAAYFGTLPADLFGIVPLKELLDLRKEAEGALALATDAPRQVVETLDGLRTVTVTWSTDLLLAGETFSPLGQHFIQLVAPADAPVRLTFHNTTSVGLDGTVTTRSTCEITHASVVLGLGDERLVTLPIERVFFEMTDTGEPDVDVDLGAVEFHGPLSFVRTLAELIAKSGLGGAPAAAARTGDRIVLAAQDAPEPPANGPYVVVVDGGVQAGLALAVPDVAIGMFSLQDLNFRSTFDLFFNGQAPLLSLSFATPQNPFRLTVSALGGGGYLGIKLSTAGIVQIAGLLEFGASVSVNLAGIAKGRASVMGGLYFEIVDAGASLTGYLRMEGHLEILSIVSMSLVMALYLSYESDGKVRGKAEISFSIKVLFFRKTVRATVEREFGGSNADPTFAELMAPADWPADTALPWDTYCRAFAAA